MGIIQSFEKRLQGAVGNTFARLFGGSVHPAEVINALQDEANGRLRHENGRIIAPNHFRVRLGPTDRKGIGEDEKRVATALSDTIREYVNEQGWDVFGDIEVDLEESSSLHTGQFRVSSLIDPDSGARKQPPSTGARPMPQPQYGYPQQPYQGYPPQPQQPYPGQYPQQPYHGYPPQPAPAYPAQPYQGGYPDQYNPNQYPDQYTNDQYGYDGQDYAQPAYVPEVVATLHPDDGSGRSYQLEHGSNVVGRGQDAAFRLPDTSVSRRHLDVYFDGHIAVMHDLGSTNGTTVNGQIVQTWQLADGDVIRLGHSTIIFNQQG